MSGEIWILENVVWTNCGPGKKILPIVQRGLILQLLFFSKERTSKWKLKASWTKGENRLNAMQVERMIQKVFIKDEPISNVWKLLDGGDVQLKDWRKQIRKKRNYQSSGLYTLKMHVFDRKRKLLRTWSWDPSSDGRDLMKWCGEFNWENGCDCGLRSESTLNGK